MEEKMNERIRELESQCWEARQYGPPWFNSQNFAELIVRDCLSIADRRGAYEVMDDIIKHFGIEP
jgi:hypothetical protein